MSENGGRVSGSGRINHFTPQPDRGLQAVVTGAQFHPGNEQVRLYRCPAVEEYLACVDPVPVDNLLLANFRGELWVPAEALEVGPCYSQWHSRGARDRVRVGIEPGLVGQFPAIRAAKAGQVESGLYALIGHGLFPVLCSGEGFYRIRRRIFGLVCFIVALRL